MFQQSADPLAAIPDRAFGGAQQLSDAGVRVPVGGQVDDALFSLERVLEAR